MHLIRAPQIKAEYQQKQQEEKTYKLNNSLLNEEMGQDRNQERN